MSFVINQFTIVGEVKKVQVSEPKNPTKNASAVLLIQYGALRESTGGPVEFVNAVMVRVPSYKFPQMRDKLREGVQVLINGHVQGVYKSVMNEGFFTAELVADRVFVQEDNSAAPAAPAAE